MPTTRLASLLADAVTRDGANPSPLPGVSYLRASRSLPRMPVVYEPGVFILAQGSKRGYLGDYSYDYGPDQYLVLSVPLPFECETRVTPGQPLLGLSVSFDPKEIASMLLEMGERVREEPPERSVQACRTPPELINAAERLVVAMGSEHETALIAPGIVREITYRVLVGERGGALHALAAQHGRYAEIAGVLREMHTAYDRPFDIERLAASLSMSTAMFHRHFKAVTSTTPLQYLKAVRLDKARLLILQEGMPASLAAQRVGYTSPSQFSREFKRHFGNAPSEEAARWRAMAS